MGYIRGGKREEKIKETKEKSPSMASFVLITVSEREALEFQAIGGAKMLDVHGNEQLGRKFCLTRNYA